MLAQDFGNGVALMRLLRLLFWAEFSLKTEKFCSSYPKSVVGVGCFSKFRCTMSL